MAGNTPKMVALAVVQSYNPRRKIPRSEISLPDLESCLSKSAFSAAQNSDLRMYRSAASSHYCEVILVSLLGKTVWKTQLL
ncbi:unnamed protein product [Sphenostylis stenocarpa]|uniref:Uncharacterized protein n=1 Tax=Sphenostylis stenocarpa TaxID=92480 RepID=A0AA86RKB0_9FABA|nr:unnamed protein product [Sphenostylis stenocarpa]